jgi:hypothetical protein
MAEKSRKSSGASTQPKPWVDPDDAPDGLTKCSIARKSGMATKSFVRADRRCVTRLKVRDRPTPTEG